VGHTVSEYCNIIRLGTVGNKGSYYGKFIRVGAVDHTVSDILMM
jgi:hypothetical protein